MDGVQLQYNKYDDDDDGDGDYDDDDNNNKRPVTRDTIIIIKQK
jgi:hypothetical protein